MSRVVHPARSDLRALVMNCVPADRQDAVLDLLVPDSGRAGREMSLTGVPVNPRRVQCSILVIAATEDRFIPARIVEKIARRYRAPLETEPEHGHMIILEPGWEALADRIENWIRPYTMLP
jgi:pimeloyl-ACP methyl ester carboxylesterase